MAVMVADDLAPVVAAGTAEADDAPLVIEGAPGAAGVDEDAVAADEALAEAVLVEELASPVLLVLLVVVLLLLLPPPPPPPLVLVLLLALLLAFVPVLR